MRRPPPASLGDRWFTSEQPLAAGMISELQRFRRRALARPFVVIALSLLVSGALVAYVVTKHRHVEAQVTLALTEGTLASDHTGVPARELREYVESVLLSDKNLTEVIERENLTPSRKRLGMPFAIENLREALEIEVWKNTFLYYRDSESSSRKSARIGLTVLDADPDKAFSTAHALAEIMIRTHDEERLRVTGEVADEVALIKERTEAELSLLAQRIAETQAQIVTARAESKIGAAAALEIQLVDLDRRHKEGATQQSQISTSTDAIADQIAAAGLDVTLAVVAERRPDRPEMSLFTLILICSVVVTAATVGTIMVVGAFDRRIHETDDVTRLGLPVLGHVPAFAGDTVGSLHARGARRARLVGARRWH